MDNAPVTPAALEELEAANPDYEVNLVSLNQWQLAWRRFKRHRLAVFGSILFLTICAIAFIGPLIAPFDFYNVPEPVKYCTGSTTLRASNGCPPSLNHFLGTTGGLQRDLLVLVINGARLSLAIGVGASVFAAVIGTIVGGVAGYFGGWIDNILMRVVDVMLSLPLLFVILVVAKFLGGGNWFVVMVVFAVFGWQTIARLVRSLFLSLRSEVFVDAARAVGVSDRRIIFRHILPNAVSPIIVATTLAVASVIVSEAFVSFLGFGVDVTQPTWGNILSNSLTFIPLGNWWWPLFPGLSIVFTVLGINFMGDGLRDALDPRSRD
ncbi:MAG TPA: ABC transporter permease [Candidatus Limnocylindrales bacterium]